MHAPMKTEPLILGHPAQAVTAAPSSRLGRQAAYVLWAAAGLFLIGSAIDLGVLWILQRQPTTGWEFVALQNTLEAFPRFMLGFAFLSVALYLGRPRPETGLRLLGATMLVLAVTAAALGALVAMDYLVLARMVDPRVPLAARVLKIAALKAVALSGADTLVLGVFGVLGIRRLKR